MKVLSIFGTRPEAIKMAPIIRLLALDKRFESFVCVTGQHRETLDQTLEEFHITPNIDLNIMTHQQNLFDITSRVITDLRPVIQNIKPDRILVQGDTSTAFAASLAAFYSGVPVGHIEAGLRTNNKRAPFPEEMNRTLISRLADLHFAPTRESKINLISEGIDEHSVFVTGNTIVDSLQWIKEKKISENTFPHSTKELQSILSSSTPIIVITCHRRETFGQASESICNAVLFLAKQHPEWHFIYMIHPNPNAKAAPERLLADKTNISLIPPLKYSAFIYLISHSTLIITDSGGLQEEASALGKPALIIREHTDRPETITSGSTILVGSAQKKIIQETESLMSDRKKYLGMCKNNNIYGDGQAANKIINLLLEHQHVQL